MTLQQILALLSPFAGILEQTLMQLDANTIQPELQKLITQVTSPDLKLLLQALDTGIDGFIQAEIKKLDP
jgi:hypothetical protein